VWLGRLKAADEGDGSVLDHSMIVYGAGLADGNAHTHHGLPTLIAGRAGGFIMPGRRIVYRAHRLPEGDADVQPVPDDDG
jgi:hypothetical protein